MECKYEDSRYFRLCTSHVSPSLVHRYSIVPPSNRWTNDGVTMEYRWSNLGGKAKEERRMNEG